MIDGVMVKQLNPHPDERGFFVEFIRVTDDFFKEGFGQLSHSHMHTGVVKAWHIHKTQIDWWCVVAGTIHVVLVDRREHSPTYMQKAEFVVGEHGEKISIKIPPGVAHGLKVIDGPADLVYATSGVYKPDEEGRIQYDNAQIGFDWQSLGGIPISNTKIT